MTAAEYQALAAALQATGYQPIPPMTAGLVYGPSIDAEVCAGAACAACGTVGLRYDPWSKEGSYRAFCVCPRCGTAEEF